MLRKISKRKQDKETEQKVDTQKQVKKDNFTEKLGIPFSLGEIEYISIIHQDLEEPMYYIAVSNRKKLEILIETRTNSKEEIMSRLEIIKMQFNPYSSYVNLGDSLPLINLSNIDFAKLIWEEHDENNNRKNHCIIGLSNGQIFHTKSEISNSNSINYNEWLFYAFSSARNDHLYGK